MIVLIYKILDIKISQGSREMRYILHKDGSFDLFGRQISLKNCYPGTDGAPLRPIRVETVENVIKYTLAQGTIEVCFKRDEEGRIAISSRASGTESIHDFSPMAEGQINEAAQIYVQGFGMEGPSGMFPIDEEQHTSHGLTALFKDSEALLLYTEDHSRYSASFRIEQKNTLLCCYPVLSASVNFEGTVGAEWEAPVLYLEEAAGGESALRHCASRIAAAMNARRTKPPAFFWSSWYYAYETMDDAMLENILSGIRKESIPFQFVELDAGYTVSIGDWLQTNHRWPKGLADAASKIRSAGLEPGIWIAPFIVGDRSQLFRNHPDWMLSGPDGKPVVRLRSYTEPKIWGNPDCDYYVLDASHPEALAYIKEVFTTLRSWGFSMFKTDFMLWNIIDYDYTGNIGLMPIPQNVEDDFTGKMVVFGSKYFYIDNSENTTQEQRDVAVDFLDWFALSEDGQNLVSDTCAMISPFKSNTVTCANDIGVSVKKYADAGLTISSYDYDPDDHYSILGAVMQRYLADQCTRQELADEIEAYWASATPVEH